MMIRKPVVAGRFYADNKQELLAELQRYVPAGLPKKTAIGVIAPHAGYIYSGAVAGHLLATVEIPATVLIIGPNHSGKGALAALSAFDYWQTPLGEVPVNKKLNDLIQKHIPAVQQDDAAHMYEHSLEVMVPFLQYLRPEVSIVPLCLGFGDYEGAKLLGNGLAAAIKEYGEAVLVLASSDMSHYESADTAREKDSKALERVIAYDPQGLVQICRSNRITMCGVIPSAVMLIAARELGATAAELVGYTNSGEVSGDMRQVVGYASVVVR